MSAPWPDFCCTPFSCPPALPNPADVEHGGFRRDLFYPLNVILIRLPSLAERREDIRPLALHFLNRINQANRRNVHLSPAALEALEAHSWPSNIRELSNVIVFSALVSACWQT